MFRIIANSFRLTFQELKVNKLRTALSLTGIAFGIFCIIGVLSTVDSLERNIQKEVKALGTNTIYIDKWDYSGNSSTPRWKQREWPYVSYEELAHIKERSELLDEIAYLLQSNSSVSYRNTSISGAPVYGIVENQTTIQPITFAAGRYISTAEFESGSPVCLLGFTNAENLFNSANNAIGKQVTVKGKKVTVVGVMAKEGKTMISWDYDNCVMLPYNYARTIYADRGNRRDAHPILIAKGKEAYSEEAFESELVGVMRQVRRLSPTQEDNFKLNTVAAFSQAVSDSFVYLNLVGGIIGGISLIVGMFGIANIMFVTVKERTPVIGLKKAIGAKKSTIMFEFLSEATLLCLLGGLIGLVLVMILAKILSGPMNFPVYVSVPMVFITLIICIVVGVLAGIIPASQAAKMDPVVAIRNS